jgi:hypothetical protein
MMSLRKLLDRYAARNENLVLAVRPHSGPGRAERGRRNRQPAKGAAGYKGQSPWLVCAFVLAAVLFSASPSWAQGETRFGVWDNSTNPNNVMTYEPYEKGGMKITVSNPSKPGDEWSYVTMFDGKFRPVTGQKGSETAVEVINEKSTRIYNKRDGVVYQVVINTLSADNNSINNEYIRMDKEGKITGVSHVTYIRRKK